jgi:hypothetical protein
MNECPEVCLNKSQLFWAGMIGVSRRIQAIFNSRPGAHGINNEELGWQRDCDGAAGEMAVAKWRNVFYEGGPMGCLTAPDVGKLQVRTTAYRDGHLLLHRTDKDHETFVLVLGHMMPVYVLAGWIVAADGKKEENWKTLNGRSAFWVPQANLHPMSELDHDNGQSQLPF